MTIASRLFDLAIELRTAVVDYYAAAPGAPALPEPQQVVNAAFAQHALDCEQFVVAVNEFGPDPGAIITADGGTRLYGAFAAGITVAVVRCVPTVDDGGNPPATAEVEASAADVLADLSLVMSAATQWATGTGSCRYVNLGRATPIGPDGGLGGVTLPLTVTL